MPALRDNSQARVRSGRRGLFLVSPPALFLLVWALAAAIAAWVLARPEANDLAHLFIARHRLDLGAFAAGPVAWALLLSGALALGYAAAGLGLRDGPAGVVGRTGEVGAAVAARRLFWVNAGFLGVTALWVALTMRTAGGFDAYLALAGTDALGA